MVKAARKGSKAAASPKSAQNTASKAQQQPSKQQEHGGASTSNARDAKGYSADNPVRIYADGRKA